MSEEAHKTAESTEASMSMPAEGAAIHGRGESLWRSAVLRERAAAVSVLLLVVWIAQFSRSFHFGLYEDDWDFIGQPMVWSWGQLLNWVHTCLWYWPQGRPIGFSVVAVIAFFGSRLGGLEAIYLIAFLLHVMNGFLLFLIARRSLSPAPSLCAALMFALYPSDTSVPLLTNGLFLGLTMFFLLSALLLYLRGSRVTAYLVSACSLLVYESAFLPFFAAPLLAAASSRARGESKLRRELVTHCAILVSIGVFVFGLRARSGEERASTLIGNGTMDTLERLVTAAYLGPLTTLRLSITRLEIAVQGLHSGWLFEALLVVIIGAALYFLKVYRSNTIETWPISLRAGGFHLRTVVRIDESTGSALRLGGCGAVMFVIAYGLAISRDHYPPIVEAGRLSGGTHIAAAVGLALLCGAAAALLLDWAVSRGRKVWAVAIVACYFGGLGGFHYRVQQDFVTSWHLQQAFWRSVVKACPDLSDGTIVIFADFSHPLRYVEANSWADPYVLAEIFRFPEAWKQPPQLYPVVATWERDVTRESQKLVLKQPFGAWPDRVLAPGKVILLKARGDGVERITGTITVQSEQLELKPLAAQGTGQNKHGSLYPYVIPSN